MSVGTDEIHQFFDEKIAGVHSSTANALPPSFSVAPIDYAFCHFQLLTAGDVVKSV